MPNDNETKGGLPEWLWKAVVQPILQELGFYPTVADPLPRIWWIGIGLMGQAPIHAAAKYKKATLIETSFQYCIPSYTSTIRALQYAQTREASLNTTRQSMLIVIMPTIPEGGSL